MSKVHFMVWPKTELAPGKLTKLERADGSADLAYDSNGRLVRLYPKVAGKALKKRTKKIRAELRRQDEAATSQKTGGGKSMILLAAILFFFAGVFFGSGIARRRSVKHEHTVTHVQHHVHHFKNHVEITIRHSDPEAGSGEEWKNS